MRAFFNIRLDNQILPDPVGQEITDDAELRAAAYVVVRALVQRHGGEAQLLDAALHVTDAEGGALLDISFFEALYLPIPPVADGERRRMPQSPKPAAPLPGAALRLMRRVGGAVSAKVQALSHV
jgi:hypothetical protein